MNEYRLIIGSLVAIAACSLLWGQEPNQGWDEVDKAINAGLPKTAIDKLTPIIESAQSSGRYPEAIKAIATKISLESTIEGNRAEEKISRMRTEIDRAPQAMKPMMEAILAHWYWHYFQQNRWRFVQRTEIADPSGDDITTWDLPRILAAIDKQFTAALAYSELLKATPIEDYRPLIEPGTADASYRPTVFDFVAHQALEFYSSGEQAGSRAIDAFELRADSPIFASATEFQNWKPESRDSRSLTLRALAIYQELLRFHQDDSNRDAFLDADLLRLRFGFNRANGEEKEARFRAALRRFADQHAEHRVSTRALYQLAEVVHGENEYVEAHKIATTGWKRFPDSTGGRLCFNLIQQIEAREANISTERVWNDPRPTIDVQYRNIDHVYFRLVRFDFAEFVESKRWQSEQLDERQRKSLLALDPVHSWTADVPPTNDYQLRVESLPAPDGIPPGSYYLIASHNQDFSDQDNQISFTEIWESRLAVVVRANHQRGLIDGFVLDASSGNPINGATVKAWRRGRRNQLIGTSVDQTDKDGRFEIQTNQRERLMILATKDGHSLSSTHYFNAGHHESIRDFQSTILFSDRSIYRPGQTIRIKGICIDVDQEQDNYQTMANRRLNLVFTDVNGKEIERFKVRTNDYGSFSGSFTAPRDRLTGRMQIRVDGGPSGTLGVTVEEYKRPKFQVELVAPETGSKLDQSVSLQGTATAYTGAAINDAQVVWRVVRQVRYPVWWSWRCWWMPPSNTASQEIAHGVAKTDSGGRFDIEFTARPDRSVPVDAEPTFRYTVYADVTDTTGETRSDQRTIHVGYTALAATLSAESWLTDDEPVEIKIQTTTLDGNGQAVSGKITVYQVRQPDRVERGTQHSDRRRPSGDQPPEPDPSDPNSWPLGQQVFTAKVETDAGGNASVARQLPTGMYRAKWESFDRFGKAVTAELPLQVIDPDADRLALKLPNLVASPKQTWQPGENYRAIWGSGYQTARAFVEVIHRGEVLQSYWTKPRMTQTRIDQQIDESMRGGFTIRTTMIRQNRAYLETRRVNVPWTNKKLDLRWEHFVSKLEPAAKETFTAVFSGSDAETAVAEMVATMYDASLDAYLPHRWKSGFDVFRSDYSHMHSTFMNPIKQLQYLVHTWKVDYRDVNWTYPHFPPRLIENLRRYEIQRRGRGVGLAPMSKAGETESFGEFAADAAPMRAMVAGEAVAASTDPSGGGSEPDRPDLSSVSPRKNLNETAFFFPHLVSADDGTVRIEFTMPEALTQWKFLGFAHDQNLRSGLLSGTAVTAKDLMVQPNPPRFLREGDEIEFTVKVSNQSPTIQSGSVRLTFGDARTGDRVDQRLNNQERDRQFEIPAGESKSISWRIVVPDGLGPVTYQAVGSTGRLSDGEEGMIPVLSRRVLMTESLPLPIRGPQSREFEFAKLLQSADSDSLEHQSLTMQMVSNPSWYAVLALPYLMEYPHQCSEQTFNRLYANALARHIADSDPKIANVFQQWRNTSALKSPLEQNQDLKSVLLEETPWYRDAQDESQARRNVGVLFDRNRLAAETQSTLQKLGQMQLADGAWPWFPGGPANDYITLYITTGFGRMRHLGIATNSDPAIKSLQRLDTWVTNKYNDMKASDREANHLTTTIALYLYGRSFFLREHPIAPQHREAVGYWRQQAKAYWLPLAHRQSQAQLAIALNRFGDSVAAKAIMQSIKERAINDSEMGMFWRDQESSWWWYAAPIETQAMMIEAFDEVAGDQDAVEACKVWLLKQKQTRNWKTTKATADAVYALLLRGNDLLSSQDLVEVALGDQVIEPASVEAGTGFYQKVFAASDVQPDLGRIAVRKTDDGVAWGSIHWQYLEDIAKITPHDGTPLKLTKQLYVKRNSDTGPQLEKVDGAVAVGDELVVRLVLRTDRDMEYIHLKDYRGSGTEPVNVLSRYRYQDGLSYYESTRDTASHFFIDYLPKGTYVFEYSARVQLRGDYQTGLAQIQCMYAPEFNSHSESLAIKVQ